MKGEQTIMSSRQDDFCVNSTYTTSSAEKENAISAGDVLNKANITNKTDSLRLILGGENVSVNRKLNSFFHEQLKAKIGVRNYLYHIKNVVLTAMEKNVLGIIAENEENVVHIKYSFEHYIGEILHNTWKNGNIHIKYFYVKNGVLVETKSPNNVFEEKPQSKIVYFNDAISKQTFENFVVSDENLTALEVCQSVACYIQKEIVSAGSVVCLHGNTATGKTHLMNAINSFYTSNGGKVALMQANLFLKKYVEAVKNQNVFSFQDEIIKNEVIIIDDIDDLVGKNGTLLELQKIIAIAMEKKKYVILTSTLSPKELNEKNQIFKTILSNAISLKLKNQQNALKTTIAMNYICDKNMNVPISIVRDLVVNINCDVRELKNYIKKLAIVQSIRKIELNTSLAFELLADDIKQDKENKTITNEQIVDGVANYYHFSANELKSAIKQKDVCKARSIAMYLMREINSANFQEIGRILNRNHSTIISGIKNVEKWLQDDKKMPAEMAEIREYVKMQ